MIPAGIIVNISISRQFLLSLEEIEQSLEKGHWLAEDFT